MPDGGRLYAFGPFRLDVDERVLLRAGQPVALTPKALAILLTLVERHGHIVEKAELMDAVWPDTAVEEGNLTQNVHTLRKVLGAPAESGVVIETVPRRGYRLNGDVTFVAQDTPGATLRAEANGGEAGGTSRGIGQIARIAADAHRYRLALAVAAVLALAAALLAWRDLSPTGAPKSDIGSMPPLSRPVNSLPGEKLHPTLSPDGERIAFVWNRGDGHNVFVTQVRTGSTLQVSFGPGGTSDPAWDPEGRSLAFIRRYIDDHGQRRAGVFITSVGGERPRLVWPSPDGTIGFGLDWSPDGALLTLSARPSRGAPQQIALVSVANGTLRWLAPSPPSTIGDDYPVFSPRGDSIAFVRHTASESRIMIVPVTGGSSRSLPVAGHDIRRIAWSSDAKELIFASRAERRLWRVALTTGAVEPLTALSDGATDPSISRRTGRLTYCELHRDINLYRVELGGPAPGRARPLAATTRFEGQGSISPDGARIAFVSARTGFNEVWIMHADGDAAAPMTDLRTATRHPRWAPDGQAIAFSAVAPGSSAENIYVIDVAGGLTRRLTTDSRSDVWPSWSADGHWIYFTSNRSGTREVWKVRASGGDPEQVTTDNGVKASESNDGRRLYYATNAPAVWSRAIDGGDSTLVFRLAERTAWGGEWVLADRGVYWVNESSPQFSIDFYDFRTRRSQVVTVPRGAYDSGGGFSVAPDGSWLVFGQQDYSASELVLVDGVGSDRVTAQSPAQPDRPRTVITARTTRQ
jgi:Tol biopolymer transport system component/DNA-binding winged helix-turn-helix (wHTH) protein